MARPARKNINRPVFLKASRAIEHHLAAFRNRYAELDEKLVPKRDGVLDMAVSDAMRVVEQRIATLEKLRAADLAGETVTDRQIAEAIGEAKPPKPPAQVTRYLPPLPLSASTAEERKAYLERVEGRKGEADPLSSEQRERITRLHEQFATDAIARVETLLADFKGAAGAHENAPVLYTQGLHLSFTMVLANLLTHVDTCVQFNRQERLALEKRVADLEARPSLEYRGVWGAAEQYRNGNAVTHDGSMWIATAGTKGVRPGDGANWKLAVKRGRDGVSRQ